MFAWPERSEALVTERVLKKGRHAVMRYRVVTEPDGDALLVYYRDFVFLEIEGIDLDDPEARKGVEILQAQVADAIPPYRVARDGKWLGATGLEHFADRLTEIFPPDRVATLRTMLANPKVRALVDGKLREVWQAWAEGWLGLELVPGDRYEGTTTIEVEGEHVPLSFLVERFAQAQDDGIRMRATQRLEGDAAIVVVGAVVSELVESMPNKPDKSLPLDTMEVRRVHLREATLDPKTLLPRRAYTKLTIAVTHEGKTTERIEEHEWTFTWTAAAAP